GRSRSRRRRCRSRATPPRQAVVSAVAQFVLSLSYCPGTLPGTGLHGKRSERTMGTHPAEGRAERLLGGSLTVLRQLRDGVVLLALGPDAVAGDFEVLMANDAALELYALRRSDLGGRGHDLMRTSGLDEAAAREITAALAAGEPATVTALVSRADGARLWVNIELTPLQTPEPGAGLWIAVSQDISSQVENAQLEQVRLDIERRARLALSIVARVSDILQEPDSADVLRAIADLVTPQVVAWSGFFVLGRSLEEAAGVVDRPDHRGGLPRHAADPAGDLLREPVMRTVRLEPGTTPEPGTVTARLYELLEPRFAQAPGAEGSVLVLPVLGRVRTLGLFVALPYQGATSARIVGPLGNPGTEADRVSV